jgi:hypothetical protein
VDTGPLALELAAPAAGYWLPRRGHAMTTGYDIEGAHFAERYQLFIIIAHLLGESLFRWRMTGSTHGARLATAGLLVLLVPLGGQLSALPLSLIVATLLSALAGWQLRVRGRQPVLAPT